MSSKTISDVLQLLDLGIATTPLALAGKSATVAAMEDHGLPVVFLRDDWRLRSGTTPEPRPHSLHHKLDSRFGDKLASGLKVVPPKSGISVVAKQFLEDLSN